MVRWKAVLPLLIFYLLVFYEERASTPSCVVLPSGSVHEAAGADPDDLKVMMVANLLLLGSKSGYLDLFFRDYYLSKFFKVSFSVLHRLICLNPRLYFRVRHLKLDGQRTLIS